MKKHDPTLSTETHQLKVSSTQVKKAMYREAKEIHSHTPKTGCMEESKEGKNI